MMPVLNRKHLLWQAKSVRDGGAPALDTATTSWVNAVVAAGGAVSGGRQTVVNALVLALKGHSLWAKCDRLWLLAGENNVPYTQIDLRNLQSWTSSGTLTRTADQGYAGNGTTGYLDTNLAPSGGTNYTQNACSLGVYNRTSRTTNANTFLIGCAGGGFNDYSYIRPRNGGNADFGLNDNLFNSAANANAQGMWTATRVSSSAVSLYRTDGGGTATVATSGASNTTNRAVTNFYIGADDDAGTTIGFSTDQIALVWIGGSLDATEAGNLTTDLNNYMTSLGTNVF